MTSAFTFDPHPVSLTIRESFRVRVPPERVWTFLKDPAQVVKCLPGAELTETIGADTYRGTVKVKVGPVSTTYDGTAQLTDVDDVARTMRLVGEGRELGAAGTARMKMVSSVLAHPEGGSTVQVDATVDIAGRIMQFGRGLIESVSRQIFRQFADAMCATLEADQIEASTPAAQTPAAQTPAAQTPAAHTGVDSADTPPPSSELRILPLLWRAVMQWILRAFGRD